MRPAGNRAQRLFGDYGGAAPVAADSGRDPVAEEVDGERKPGVVSVGEVERYGSRRVGRAAPVVDGGSHTPLADSSREAGRWRQSKAGLEGVTVATTPERAWRAAAAAAVAQSRQNGSSS